MFMARQEAGRFFRASLKLRQSGQIRYDELEVRPEAEVAELDKKFRMRINTRN